MVLDSSMVTHTGLSGHHITDSHSVILPIMDMEMAMKGNIKYFISQGTCLKLKK